MFVIAEVPFSKSPVLRIWERVGRAGGGEAHAVAALSATPHRSGKGFSAAAPLKSTRSMRGWAAKKAAKSLASGLRMALSREPRRSQARNTSQRARRFLKAASVSPPPFPARARQRYRKAGARRRCAGGRSKSPRAATGRSARCRGSAGGCLPPPPGHRGIVPWGYYSRYSQNAKGRAYAERGAFLTVWQSLTFQNGFHHV